MSRASAAAPEPPGLAHRLRRGRRLGARPRHSALDAGAKGQAISEQALQAGHQVVGAVRRPETLKDISGIEVARIDLADQATLEAAMRGADMVISALGHGGLKASAQFTTL